MGELKLNGELAAMVSQNRLNDADVVILRQTVFADGIVNREEAESLFALDHAVASKSAAWVDFFVEAVTDYLVNVEAPQGYISNENAQWLIRAISSDGLVDSHSELEILLRCMEKATSMPASLSAFALHQVSAVVTDGTGPLANGRRAVKGTVTADDVKMLRRVLYAYSGDTGLGISRDEAEVLFDINDKTVESANDASWSDLFSKAVAFSLMASVGHAPVDRQEALRREEWLDDTSVSVTDFMGGIFAGGLRGFLGKLASDTTIEGAHKARNEMLDHNNKIAETINLEEANWLVERIGRDGVLHENERMLIEFLKKESPDLHPTLKPLLDKVA